MSRYFVKDLSYAVDVDTLRQIHCPTPWLMHKLEEGKDTFINVSNAKLGVKTQYHAKDAYTSYVQNTELKIYFGSSDYYKLEKYSYESDEILIRYINGVLFVYYEGHLYRLYKEEHMLQDYYIDVIRYTDELILRFEYGIFFEFKSDGVYQFDNFVCHGEAMSITQAKTVILTS